MWTVPLFAAIAVLTAGNAQAQEAAAMAGPLTQELLAGEFRWRATDPVVLPAQRLENPCHAIKDPSVVYWNGKWHLFCTIRGQPRTHAVEYLSFADWSAADQAPRHVLTASDGFYCAPQVFYFRPQRKWYLICQASDATWNPRYGAAYATSDDLADPGSWSGLRPLEAHTVGDNAGLDFWVICDGQKAHLFFTTLDGRMWREETSLAEFPGGWSEPVLAIEGDIFEASHTYLLRGLDKYLTLVEAQDGHGWRYYKAYLADRLDGEWTPLAASRDQTFASMANVRFPGPRWSDVISHGELLRAGYDERLEVDPTALCFLFQGVTDEARAGKPYGEIPWRLGLLEWDEGTP
jgi:hypothetical protein